MFKDNDIVAVKHACPNEQVSAGQIGTIICCFTVPNEAYEVEFLDDEGKPIAQLTLLPDELETYRL